MIDLNNIAPITKKLIILNIVVFVVQNIFPDFEFIGALHFFKSPDFEPYQIISHMFMHGGFTHILFNMFGLFIFGSPIENRLGGKKFLIYYLLTGFGAVFLHMGVQLFENYDFVQQIELAYAQGIISNDQLRYDYIREFSVTVGASGAIFGLLAAFGLLFPNQPLYLIFIPVPIKAKFFVLLYAGYELYQGIQFAAGDNIAHFAHLGGALFGWIIITEWRKKHLI